MLVDTQITTNFLKALGCTHVLLNASPLGQPVDESLSFSTNNAMHLDF